MMPIPPGAPLSVRLGARLGPETVASALIVAVIVVAVSVALTGQRGSASGPSQGPAATAAPSVAAVVPSVVTVPSPVASPSATPAPTPAPTARPAQASRARAVLTIVDRLIDEGDDLEVEIARSSTGSAAIPDLLRDINASIVLQDGPLADLAADPATADLASRLREVNDEVADTIRRTQHTSPRNAKTYRDGAVVVVEKLEPLPGLRAELAALAG